MNIQLKDITVVVQGPINYSSYKHSEVGMTQQCINSIKRLLPDAVIILSTWEHEDVRVTGFDQLVTSVDPGPQKKKNSIANNVNRQIVSTVSGIKHVNTTYCLKIRADIVLESINFINYFEKNNDECQADALQHYKLFKSKVISNNLTSRNPDNYFKNGFNCKLLFHISDHVHFGYTSDLQLLWDIPLQNEEEAFFFYNKAFPEQFKTNEYARFSPEQYLAVNFLNKKFAVGLKNYADWSRELEKESEIMLLSNFIFLKDEDYKFYFEKYHTEHERKFEYIRYNQNSKPCLSKSINDFSVLSHMNKPKLSIIIPAYKSLPYIEDTINSILQQSYQEYELIIVRNGDYSDRSEDNYFESIVSNNKIKVIKILESNANLARKIGVSESIGDYIYIIDADDVLELNAFELISDNIKNYSPDCIAVGFSVFTHADDRMETVGKYFPSTHKRQLSNYRCDSSSAVLDILTDYNHTFWCYVFKRNIVAPEFINTEMKYYEELPTLISCFNMAKTISFLPSCIYKYRHGTLTQLTSSWGNKDRLQKIQDFSRAISTCTDTVSTATNSALKKYFYRKAINIAYAEFHLSERSDSFNQEVLYKQLKVALSHINTYDFYKFSNYYDFARLVLLKNLSRKHFLSLNKAKDRIIIKLRLMKQLVF